MRELHFAYLMVYFYIMRKASQLRSRKGFTLVESMVVAIVLGVGLFAVGTAFVGELDILSKEKNIAIATLSAQEEIEKIRGMAFDDILALGTSFTSNGFTYLKNPVGTLTIDDIYNNNNICRVTATVSWRSMSGVTLQRSVATLVTRGGINKQ